MNGPTFAAPARPPVGGKPPAPPRPPHKPDADNPTARVLAYLRLHWLTILFAGGLLGGGLAYAAWTLLPPKYESYALFRVAQAQSTVAGNAELARTRGNFTTDVKTYATLMKTEFVYRYALREHRLADLPTLKGQKDLHKFLDEKLLVSSKEGSEIITLSMVGDNPEDVRKIVDAMVDAYQQEVILKEKTEANNALKRLLAAKTNLEKQLANKNGATTDLPNPVANLPTVGPVGANPDPNVKQASGVGDRKPADPTADTDRMVQARFPQLMARFAKLEETLPDLRLAIGVAKAEVDRLKGQIQEVMDEAAPVDVDKWVRENDADVKKAADKAKRLGEQFTQKYAEAVNKGAPSIVRLEAELEQANVDAEKLVREKVKLHNQARREPRVRELNGFLDRAKVAYDVAVSKLKDHTAEMADIKEKLKAIPPAPEKVAADKAKEPEKPVTPSDVDKQVTVEKLHEINAQYQMAELNANSPPRVTVPQPATAPIPKDPQKQIMATVFAGLLGFVLVAGVCVGLEMRARKVSSLGELRAAAPAPVVGVVPHAPDAATARDPVKRAEVNEAIDKLRAYVAQTWLARGATTVAVTSPLGDEGKSFTAFGLASSLAQAGMKTLLVDFDLRNATLHSYAGLPNGPGVCELLRGETDFRRTIQVLPNGLHFLGGGRWSDEARQAAVGGRLESLLARLKEPFDCVVLHADALLTVAESVEVARRSEVLLLCALYRTTRSPLLKKAADRAAAMEIPYTGVVYVGATATEALC